MGAIILPVTLDPAALALVLSDGTYTQLVTETLGDAASDADGWPQAFAAADAIAQAGKAQLPTLDGFVDNLGPDPSVFDLGTAAQIIADLDSYLGLEQSILDALTFLVEIGGDLALITAIGDVINAIASDYANQAIDYVLSFFGY